MAKPWHLVGKQIDHYQIILDDKDLPVGTIQAHRPPGQRRRTWAVKLRVAGEDPVFVGPYVECVAFIRGVEYAAEKNP